MAGIQHLVAEAMAHGKQKQLARVQLLDRDCLFARKRVLRGRDHAEDLLVQRHRRDARAFIGQGEDHGVQFARLQHPVEVGGGVFLHVQWHFRRAAPQRPHQVRQKVRRDRVDDAQAQHALERVAPLARHRFYAVGLFQRTTRLRHDLLARLGEEHAALAAFKQGDAELLLEVLHGGREAGLADVAALGRLAEMPHLGDGNHVPEFSEGHRT